VALINGLVFLHAGRIRVRKEIPRVNTPVGGLFFLLEDHLVDLRFKVLRPASAWLTVCHRALHYPGAQLTAVTDDLAGLNGVLALAQVIVDLFLHGAGSPASLVHMGLYLD